MTELDFEGAKCVRGGLGFTEGEVYPLYGEDARGVHIFRLSAGKPKEYIFDCKIADGKYVISRYDIKEAPVFVPVTLYAEL